MPLLAPDFGYVLLELHLMFVGVGVELDPLDQVDHAHLELLQRLIHIYIHLASVKKITFQSSYNWFKIDILRQLRPPTAIFSHIHSPLN